MYMQSTGDAFASVSGNGSFAQFAHNQNSIGADAFDQRLFIRYLVAEPSLVVGYGLCQV